MMKNVNFSAATSKKYAVITGASSGIGAEFAKRLSAKGYPLVLIARQEEKLKEVAKACKTACVILPADLSREEECYRIFYELKDKKVGIFINNAGFGDCGSFTETDLQKEVNMIQLNCKAVHILMKLMLKKMGKTGFILNVASSAGLLPAGPYMATYYATKAYVTSLTRAVAEELKEKGSRIYVGCLCPGPVDTEFNRRANVQFALQGITAKACVAYALKQMAKRRIVIVPTLRMKLAVNFGRVLPQEALIRMTAAQQKRKIYS